MKKSWIPKFRNENSKNNYYNEEQMQLMVISMLKERNVDAVVNECFAKGGEGTLDLAEAVIKNIDDKPLKFAYNFEDKVETKIESIVKKPFVRYSVSISIFVCSFLNLFLGIL